MKSTVCSPSLFVSCCSPMFSWGWGVVIGFSVGKILSRQHCSSNCLLWNICPPLCPEGKSVWEVLDSDKLSPLLFNSVNSCSSTLIEISDVMIKSCSSVTSVSTSTFETSSAVSLSTWKSSSSVLTAETTSFELTVLSEELAIASKIVSLMPFLQLTWKQ